MNDVYVTSAGAFLPGPPIGNERAEEILGKVFGKPSRLRARVLRNNGIRARHYAMDDHQRTTHQNEDLAAAAIAACLDRSSLSAKDVQMLAVASTQGDLVLPGFGSMVQAKAGIPACELLTTHGICACGMTALKAAFNELRAGENANALVCASELASRNLKRSRYEASRAADDDGRMDLDSEFLRWMLSDGAGAVLLQRHPAERTRSLRVDWIRILSHAGSYPVCMSAGRSTRESALPSWQDYDTYAEAERDGALLLRQNLDVLENVVKLGVEGFLRLIEESRIAAAGIDHFLCHYSSHYFRGKIASLLEMAGAVIPEERWFTNLYTKGNTGCASMFIMLDEFLSSGRAKPGETVFCFVPESGRFTTAYMKMTVVDAGTAEGSR